jgi:hypothetical protein
VSLCQAAIREPWCRCRAPSLPHLLPRLLPANKGSHADSIRTFTVRVQKSQAWHPDEALCRVTSYIHAYSHTKPLRTWTWATGDTAFSDLCWVPPHDSFALLYHTYESDGFRTQIVVTFFFALLTKICRVSSSSLLSSVPPAPSHTGAMKTALPVTKSRAARAPSVRATHSSAAGLRGQLTSRMESCLLQGPASAVRMWASAAGTCSNTTRLQTGKKRSTMFHTMTK